ncbi:type II toxin-antitoxin system mRNA interferase toxin, RelE/StbE family [Candidatus Uhrbacteria bacterium]|nr:type II toxin-antitoxin system mRNA interferase toxin, RelE/StbE family [Candidatus Uhrbacteria bacterium]
MEVKFHTTFKKKLKKISSKIQERFYEQLELFVQDKFNSVLNNHSVDRAYKNCRSINVSGDYRAIFENYGETIIFITIGTHSSLY